MPEEPPPKPSEGLESRIGRFISKYNTFLSSFVIGIAGLVATSIWQFRQAETAQHQAQSQQKIAETQAANSWKIERAEILGKNLGVLAATGSNTADQRYGVLLSLTRAEILDPELTMSYALELGKDNTDYMVSVLANTDIKDYTRLVHAYALSCDKMYGVTPALDVCADPLAARSDAIGQMVANDVIAEMSQPFNLAKRTSSNPLSLLSDERNTQLNIQRYVAMYETAVTTMYERRQWSDLAKFAAYAPGAHLVLALVISAARTGELTTQDQVKVLDRFHGDQINWLGDYLFGKSCDAECKGRVLEVMVSQYEESKGEYDAAMRRLLKSPRALAGVATSRLNARLLWCQVGDDDIVPMRDHVLVPAAKDALAPGMGADVRAVLLDLLALVPEPDPELTEETEAWTKVLAGIDKIEKAADKPGHAARTMSDRRATAAFQREHPPRALRKLDFCLAASKPDAVDPTVPDAARNQAK